MNNGTGNPTSRREQISFYNKDGNILYGMQTMYRPHNGKLAYGKGRVCLVHAHYNYFGAKSGGHTGDSLFCFDESGRNERYGWSWGASHSLIQSIHYDGNLFVTASLGDMFPKNIKICAADPRQETGFDKTRNTNAAYKIWCKNLIEDGEGINGNGTGKACGRLGGIMRLGKKYAVAYARSPCTVRDYYGKTQSSKRNEIGIVTFEINGTSFTNFKITSLGQKASNVVGLRSGKYGKNIYITYATVSSDSTGSPTSDRFTGSSEKQYGMLVNFDGKILNGRFDVSTFSLPQSDDLRVLKDGTLAWGAVDSAGNLKLHYTQKPPFKIQPDTTPSFAPVSPWQKSDDNPKPDGSSSPYLSVMVTFLGMLVLFLF
ncbi:MAG: hypothetical protein GY861_23040 [bacterium]|nr:hypothetical protein [bacterium]